MIAALARKAATLLLILAAGTGCARYYYGKSAGTYADFLTDSIACARDFGIASGNGQYAAVSPDFYRRCMLAKGWEREKRLEPVEVGQFRGVEDNEPVSLAVGPAQPVEPDALPRGTGKGAQMQCWRRYIENRSDWRERIPAYRECVGQ
jgi:hypothetical protein